MPQEGPNPARRIFIPHTSWAATFFWWKRRLLKPIRNFVAWLRGYRVPPPPKGPQIWSFPPNSKYLDRTMKDGEECVVGRWEEEVSGWTMTTVLPPPRARTKIDGDGVIVRSVLYFYGSGFQAPISIWHWGFIGYLARELEAEVIVVPYPLAPTNNAMEVMPVLTQVYKAFLARAVGREPIIAGDSAGGRISMCLAFAAHDAGLPLPSQIIAISPSVGVISDDAGVREIAPYDNVLTPEYCQRSYRLWCGLTIPPELQSKPSAVRIPPEIRSNPHINPSAGNLRLLAEAGTKLVIVSATWDILHAYMEQFVAKCEDAGVDLTYVVGEHQFHCFPVSVDVSPECTEAVQAIVRLVIMNGADSGKMKVNF